MVRTDENREYQRQYFPKTTETLFPADSWFPVFCRRDDPGGTDIMVVDRGLSRLLLHVSAGLRHALCHPVSKLWRQSRLCCCVASDLGLLCVSQCAVLSFLRNQYGQGHTGDRFEPANPAYRREARLRLICVVRFN